MSRLARLAERSPRALAILDGADAWTYGDLWSATEEIATLLIARGIRAGDRVAIVGDRSARFVGAFLGVLRVNAVAVPVDAFEAPMFVADGIRRLRPKLRIDLLDGAQAAASPPSTSSGEPVLSLSRLKPGWKAPVQARLPVYAPIADRSADPAYILQTSGTTGERQGVLVSHRPLPHFLAWCTRRFRFNSDDRFAMLASVSYDPFLRDAFAPLWVGAAVAVPSRITMSDPRRLVQWLERQAISVVHIGPAALRRLLRHALAQHEGAGGPPALPTLRYVFVHGDVTRWGDVALLRRAAPGARCVSYYGATETPQAMAWFETSWELPPVDRVGSAEALPLGRPIDDVELLVVTGDGRRARPGERGEILVRTPYLAYGYVDNPALTADRFLPNPLTGDARDRVFRTGDLGWFRPDGCVVFAGRSSSMIKIEGSRVDPLLVERTLLSHPGIVDAKVGSRRDSQSGELRLIAWLSPKSGAPSAAELMDFLGPRLPVKMIPELRFRDELASGQRGKVLAGDGRGIHGGEAPW